jgi:hypothetical protein
MTAPAPQGAGETAGAACQQQAAQVDQAAHNAEGEKAEQKSDEDEQRHKGLVAGAAVGLPVMDYVPISINQVR